MINTLRWLGMVPACFVAWWLSLLLGFGLLEVANRFCPAEDFISGMCVAPWFRYVEDGIIAGCAAIAAAAIVLVAVMLAPSHRLPVASVVLGAGILVALYMGYATQAWGSFVAAVLAGGAPAFLSAPQRRR